MVVLTRHTLHMRKDNSMQRTHTPRRILVAVSAAVLVAAGTWFTLPTASAGTLSGTLYRDPNGSAAAWVSANSGDPRAAAIRDRIVNQPQARWFTTVNPNTIQSETNSYVSAANAAG